MTQLQKLIAKLKNAPQNAREQECERLVTQFGFVERTRTSGGSARVWVNHEDGRVITWHSPHAGMKTMRIEAVKAILSVLGIE